jgi:hydroxymethylbilane synthase
MSIAEKKTIRLGTRSSALARWQAEWVAARLRETGQNVELIFITTSGDAQQVGSIGAIGGQGVFTKEIQRALLDGRVDLAVHSLKDLPTEPVEHLVLAAVPPREVVADVLISQSGQKFTELPAAARIGTGSARRQSQLRHARPELQYLDIRGNVDTRLNKLAAGEYDAIILAAAGLTRLGLAERITEELPRGMILPAVGQGALGLETRAEDTTTISALAALNDVASHAAVLAERAMLATLRGGCLAPVGGWARFESESVLALSGTVLSLDGTARLLVQEESNVDLAGETWPEQAMALGEAVALQLIQSGAERLIAAARS